MSRAAETLASLPPATLSIVGTCVAVYAYQLLFDPPLHHYTMCPRLVIYLHEYYRLVTSCVFHGSLMHLGMNMMSAAAISTMLERRFGTIKMGITVLWAILLTSAVYAIVSLLLHLVLGLDGLMHQHSVGFSGVLFHLSVLESNLNPHRTRSVFGTVRVPSRAYPWALLVVLQFIMPQISFLGHLSGILTGTLHLYGVLDGTFMVGDEYVAAMENWEGLRFLTGLSGFVKVPSPSSSDGSQLGRDPAALLGAVWGAVKAVWKFARDVLETIQVCIFGRGRAANANVRFGSAAGGAADVESAVDGPVAIGAGDTSLLDDDDWVGLPPMPEEAETRVV